MYSLHFYEKILLHLIGIAFILVYKVREEEAEASQVS